MQILNTHPGLEKFRKALTWYGELLSVQTSIVSQVESNLGTSLLAETRVSSLPHELLK